MVDTTPDTFVQTRLVAKDQTSFEKAIADLTTLAESASSDPNVQSFAVCAKNSSQVGVFPSNDDPLTLLVLQRYKSTPPPPFHLDVSLFKTQTSTTSQAAIDLTRDEPLPKDAYIITASFLYEIGRATDALPGWESFVEYMRKTEDQTYIYSVFQLQDTLSTFEVYSNPKYVADVHLKSSGIVENGKQNGQWRVKGAIYATRWHLKAGFLGRK